MGRKGHCNQAGRCMHKPSVGPEAGATDKPNVCPHGMTSAPTPGDGRRPLASAAGAPPTLATNTRGSPPTGAWRPVGGQADEVEPRAHLARHLLTDIGELSPEQFGR